MAKCSYCGTLMWGGITDRGHRFCSEKCHQNARILTAAHQLPVEQVEQEIQSVHQGHCPQCGGVGPVDIYKSHRAISLIFVTTWASQTHVCCRSCGRKAQLIDLLISLVVGWWGFPFGLVATPIQIVRNLGELLQPPDPNRPSLALQQAVLNYLGQTIQAEAGNQNTIDLSNLPTLKAQEAVMTQVPRTDETQTIATQIQVSQTSGTRRLSKFLRWLLVGLSGLMVLGALSPLNLGAVLGFGLATAAVLPLLDDAIAARLPWLKSAWLKGFAWIVLLIVGFSALPSAPSPSASPTPLLPTLMDVKLCTQPQQNLCQTDTTQLVQDTKQLYLSATAENIPDGTEFALNLTHTPEPSKSKELQRTTAKAKIQDGKLLLTMKPKSLPIGSYDLKLTSTVEGGSISEAREFTVWDTAKDVKVRSGNALPESDVEWTSLKMCDRSGKPVSKEEEVPVEMEICTKDTTQFQSTMTAVGLELGATSDLEGNKVKVVWTYINPQNGKRIIANEAVNQFKKSNTLGFYYTLTSSDGFPPGNYEVLVALETKNAKPIYRKFTVKAA